MDLNQLWQSVLSELENVVSKASIKTWTRDTLIIDMDEDKAIIGLPSIFAQSWFEKKYQTELEKIFKRLTDNKVKKITYKVLDNQTAPIAKSTSTRSTKQSSKPAPEQINTEQADSGSLALKSFYTFENFVVGSGNRLAYATSLAVAKNPGRSHNPLVIYGGVGLGKTHLMQAIGNTVLKDHPELRVMYISCEDFANEYISSIQNKKTESFKKKYRTVDIFLVDDIQFLSNKEGTQQEFFHTFNSLHQRDCQIVMTSDRMPTAIPKLEDRLSSRFAMGMVADIQAPNLETRLAILREKSQKIDTQIDSEVLDLIAQNIHSNIRELEGALNRVLAYADMQNEPLTVEIAKEALREIIGNTNGRIIDPEKLINYIATHYGITRAELVGPKRTKELVRPRKLTMYLLKHELDLSYPKIGQAMGGKDHSTIMHGVANVEKELGKNSDLRDEITNIRKEIYNN